MHKYWTFLPEGTLDLPNIFMMHACTYVPACIYSRVYLYELKMPNVCEQTNLNTQVRYELTNLI